MKHCTFFLALAAILISGTLRAQKPPVGDGIWALNGTNAFYNGGFVGIGTDTPDVSLTLKTASNFYGLQHTDGTIRLATFLGGSAGGGWLGTISNDKLNFFVNNGKARMTVDTTGNVGIGTTAPAAKLTVQTAHGTNYGIEHTDGSVRLSTYVAGSGGYLGTRSDHPLHFFVRDFLTAMTIGADTNVGIGTDTPEAKLEVRTASNSYGLFHSDGTVKLATFVGGGAGGGWLGTFSPHKLNFFVGGGGPSMTVSTAGDVGIGTVNPEAKLHVVGTTRTSVLTITGGVDLAEPFQMKEDELKKGSVVVIDDEHPGRLKGSRNAYDRHVAGIVSGANGINPGISLQQEGVIEGGQNVALSGRVYVQADASGGAIKPGDLLTTSDIPGHAMKAADHVRAQGAVIGKAMSSLQSGKGMVLVLVTLQ